MHSILGKRSELFPQRIYHRPMDCPSNQIRHVAADTFGFLWLATDAGLVRFDGQEFKVLSKSLPSQSGRFLLNYERHLLYSHDAGISKIPPRLDTIVPVPFLESSIDMDEQSLYYPNQIFVQNEHTLWISQPNGRIARWQNGQLKQFDLGPENRTGSSDSKFEFATTSTGTLWTVSQTGRLHLFDPHKEAFHLQKEFGFIHDMVSTESNLWLAGDQLYHLELNSNGDRILKVHRVTINSDTITAMARDTKGNMFLAIKDQGTILPRSASRPRLAFATGIQQ